VREADSTVVSAARGLDAAEESYRVRGELFTVGRSTSVELTDAETELTQARLNAIGARIDQRASRMQLLHALGRDTHEP
jgi:outer membrane protein TolC